MPAETIQLKQGAQQKYGVALPQYVKGETLHDLNTKMIFDHHISVFLLLNSIGKNESSKTSDLNYEVPAQKLSENIPGCMFLLT